MSRAVTATRCAASTAGPRDAASRHGLTVSISIRGQRGRRASATDPARPSPIAPATCSPSIRGEAFDFIVSSQFTHHLTDDQVAMFIRWMEAHARRGWFIGDLHRHWLPYYGFGLLAWAARWHHFVLQRRPHFDRARLRAGRLAPAGARGRSHGTRCCDHLASAVPAQCRATLSGPVIIGGGPAGAAAAIAIARAGRDVTLIERNAAPPTRSAAIFSAPRRSRRSRRWASSCPRRRRSRACVWCTGVAVADRASAVHRTRNVAACAGRSAAATGAGQRRHGAARSSCRCNRTGPWRRCDWSAVRSVDCSPIPCSSPPASTSCAVRDGPTAAPAWWD